MCVRCGTGAIAWCVSPDRHESEKAVTTPFSSLDDVLDAMKAVITPALTAHQELGTIREWRPSLDHSTSYVVTLSSGTVVALTIPEARALVYGLNSAYQAGRQ